MVPAEVTTPEQTDEAVFTTPRAGMYPETNLDAAFLLTDVLVFPLVLESDPGFVVRYRIERDNLMRFQYNTVATDTNWSQHLTAAIVFEPGTTVNVANTDLSSGTTGFQLLGYLGSS